MIERTMRQYVISAVLGCVLLVHGLLHINVNDALWLLPFWSVAAIGFIHTGLALIIRSYLWWEVTTIAALASIVTIAASWSGPWMVAGLAIDLAVLTVVLAAHVPARQNVTA